MKKEFHELMREMEEWEQKASPGPWYTTESREPKDQMVYDSVQGPSVLMPYSRTIHGAVDKEFIALSRTFIPLAIDRIKRLERALEIAISTIETIERFDEKKSLGESITVKLILEELGE